ncbi:MAG: hypothetical protein V3W14_03170 [Candidatus Neomarinimicrobiota bacterium]
MSGVKQQTENPVKSFIGALLQATVDHSANLELDASPDLAVESNSLSGRLYGQAYLESQGDRVRITYRMHNADGAEVLTGVLEGRL